MKSSVIGIIFDSTKKKILIIQRRDVPVWVFPGGGIDHHETPEHAVIREVFEETGLKVSIVRKIGEYTPINKLAHFTHVFECASVDGELLIGDETRAINYFYIDRLPKSFFVVHLEWLIDAMHNHPSTLKKTIESVTYLKLFNHFLKHPLHVLRFALSRLGIPINSK